MKVKVRVNFVVDFLFKIQDIIKVKIETRSGLGLITRSNKYLTKYKSGTSFDNYGIKAKPFWGDPT